MILKLPYPVSNNRNARMYNGRMVTSKEAVKYKADVGWIAKAAQCKILEGAVSVTVSLHPKTTKSGAASKTLLDLDNTVKCVFDALNGIAWKDDKQVVKLFMQVDSPIENGGLTVVIEGL